MPKTVVVNGVRYWLNDLLKENFDWQKQLIAKNWDNFTICSGMEGTGKTRFAAVALHYLTDGKFNENDIVFTPEEFEAWILSKDRKPGDGLLWDEFVLVGMSQDALQAIQKKIIKYMTLMRKMRFHIYLVIPYIFMLRKYFVVGRARNLIHVAPRAGDAMERGDFWFFNYKKKRQLYVRGYKTWEFHCAPDFKGHFQDAPPKLLDWEEYERRKDKAIMSIDEENAPTRVKQLQHHRAILIHWLKHLSITQKEIAERIGISEAAVSGAMNKIKDST